MKLKRKYAVLLVDDEQVIVNIYQQFLQAPDVHIVTALSIADALEKFDREKFDLIITDLVFASKEEPGGFDLISKVKQKSPKTKLVLITGFGDSKVRQKAKELGVDLYLEKPILARQLRDQLRPLMQDSESIYKKWLCYLKNLWPRNVSKLLQFSMDSVVLISALLFAWLLRFDFVLSKEQMTSIVIQLPFVLLVQFASLLFTGVYSFIWRFVGLREIKSFAVSALISFLVILSARLFLPIEFQVLCIPISIIIMDIILGFGGVVLLRFSRRAIYERFQKNRLQTNEIRKGADSSSDSRPKPKNVFLIGAGQAGLLAAKEILNRGELDINLKGFIDDDPVKLGTVIHGIRVLGNTSVLPDLVRRHQIDYVIITIATASRMEITRIVQLCDTIPVKARIIPGLFELIGGKVEVSRIRDVEIVDLLGRDKVDLELDTIAQFISGKRIMVTGAGGSIGSELVRQISKFHPAKILIVERSEFALYLIQKEMCRSDSHDRCVPLLADIADDQRMESIFAQYSPHVVLHAAAHKHVPLMEFNPAEAIKNNSIGTLKLGHLAGKYKTEVFVLISTDKAVNPTSVMGASKRIAELFIQSLNSRYATKYIAVRFGNVLGSTGSVIPLFKEQIAHGGPVTVTHPDMTRYFMTIPEATQLVLQAGAIGKGSEIFILDMGDPVKITHLAESMIRLSGLKPNEDIQITFTGLRPGEKLFEELNTTEDQVSKTVHPKIFIGKIITYPDHVVDTIIDRLSQLALNRDSSDLRRYIIEILPEANLTIQV